MVQTIRVALVIARRSLRQRIRDRSAILFAFVAPFVLAAMFSLLLHPNTDEFTAAFVLVDRDGGPVAQAFRVDVLGALVDEGVVELSSAPDEAAARALVAGDAAAAIVIPAGFSADVGAGRRVEIAVLGNADKPIGEALARSVVARFADGIEAVQLSVRAAVHAGAGNVADPAAVAAIAQRAAAAADPVSLAGTAADRREASLSTYYAASMGIMFLFFSTQYGAIGLITERRQGTLARLLAAPIAPMAILLGAALAGFAIGLVGISVLAAATTLLFGAGWGPPLPLALLLVAAVASASGISTLVATLARSEEQAGAWNAIVAMTLAILGGAFAPISNAPELLARLGMLTPHGWFLHGIDSLAVPTAGPADIAGPVLVLLAIGAITGAVGLARSRSILRLGQP